MKRILSKSQANLFLQCPYKWKKCYIDKIKSEPSYPMLRGIRIHKKIENFYGKNKSDFELKKFNIFETKRLQQLKDLGKTDTKYMKPIFQELKMQDEELGLKGIVDAVFINPVDDELIVIDWKSGKYCPEKFDEYRFELAVYVELLKASGNADKIKYWGICFVDQDELFFEEVDEKYIKKMYQIMDEVREGIEKGEYPAKKNCWCMYCQFKKECPLNV